MCIRVASIYNLEKESLIFIEIHTPFHLLKKDKVFYIQLLLCYLVSNLD